MLLEALDLPLAELGTIVAIQEQRAPASPGSSGVDHDFLGEVLKPTTALRQAANAQQRSLLPG